MGRAAHLDARFRGSALALQWLGGERFKNGTIGGEISGTFALTAHLL
ncbi:MAG: hypothetical protein OEM15_11245 [Myxococcales bacterium]|nr:hypothetical protein [Myxococcales bacterium]MDH3483184.1 hypothetical protein [Myxococcales bacterium]